MDRKTKTIFQLDTPYSSTQWPEITPDSQQNILELLVSLLSPIGRHHSAHNIPSKGKRSKKRKREETKTRSGSSKTTDVPTAPPVPEIARHVLVGLGCISRELEALSRLSETKSLRVSIESFAVRNKAASQELTSKSVAEEAASPRHIAAVFVSRSSQPSILHAHMPQLIATASAACPNDTPIRLVQLPKGCEESLCASLGLPRVGFIAVREGAPHSTPLINFVKDNVPVIHVRWLEEARISEYKPVKINAIQTTVSPAPAKNSTKPS